METYTGQPLIEHQLLITMEFELYTHITNYLIDLILSENLTKEQRASVKRKARYFIVKNKQLYKKNKNSPNSSFKVLKKEEVNDILYYFHEDPLAGHFNIEETFRKVKVRYYWPQMYDDIRRYIKSCDQCQKRGKNKRIEPLHIIPVE